MKSLDIFDNYDARDTNVKVCAINGGLTQTKGQGWVHLSNLQLHLAMFVLELKYNLILVRMLTKYMHCQVIFCSYYCKFLD